LTIFKLEPGDVVHVVDPHYSDTYYINLERIVYLEEVRRKPTPNNPHPEDSWHVRVDGVNLNVTEAAFNRIRQAMS
jgi:hypothetical protein